MKQHFFILTILIFFGANLSAQDSTGEPTAFVDLLGYTTLRCDFHTHSVFSDGDVWPAIRVQEAVREELDCLAITEHLEYLPKQDDLPVTDRNRAYKVALNEAEDSGLIVINGAEITRPMPPGHSNAVFVRDAGKLLKEDIMDVYVEADAQGAFVFNNHPDLTYQRPDAIARFEPLHIKLIQAGLIQGIEIVNLDTYSKEALQLALDHDLTILGNSDIHGTTDRVFNLGEGDHRPSTLVFARERTKAGIRDALLEQRTVVWFKDQFIGRDTWLNPFLKASLTAEVKDYVEKTVLLEVVITNSSPSPMLLKNRSSFSFYRHTDLISVDSGESVTLSVKTVEKTDRLSLSFEVLNAITAPGEHPVISYELMVN